MQFFTLSALLLPAAVFGYPKPGIGPNVLGTSIDTSSPVPHGNGQSLGYIIGTAPGQGGLSGFSNAPFHGVSGKFRVQPAKVPVGGSSQKTYQVQEYIAIGGMNGPNTCVTIMGMNTTVMKGVPRYNSYYGSGTSAANLSTTVSSLKVDAGDTVSISFHTGNPGSAIIGTFENTSKNTKYTQNFGKGCAATEGGWLVVAPSSSASLPKLGGNFTIPKLGFQGGVDQGLFQGGFILVNSAENSTSSVPVIDCGIQGSRGLNCAFNN